MNRPNGSQFEQNSQYLTIGATAELLGLKYWKIQRAVRLGIIPSYRFLNGRALLVPAEVAAVIKASIKGGEL